MRWHSLSASLLVTAFALSGGGRRLQGNDLTGEAPLRVRIANRFRAAAVRETVLGAQRRLARGECRKVFRDFSDSSGRPLEERLDLFELTGESWLPMIVFLDGAARRPCMDTSVDAFTSPGSRVVWVCPQLALRHWSDPRAAELVIIHEELHTLGLGEDPPSSWKISTQVAARCWQ